MNILRGIFAGFVALGLLATCDILIEQASAQSDATAARPVYVVIHIDIVPTPAGLGSVNALLKDFVADSRKDQGNMRVDVLVQDGKPNHFVVLETWRSRAAFDAHNAAEHTRKFREKIQPALGSPFDERLHGILE